MMDFQKRPDRQTCRRIMLFSALFFLAISIGCTYPEKNILGLAGRSPCSEAGGICIVQTDNCEIYGMKESMLACEDVQNPACSGNECKESELMPGIDSFGEYKCCLPEFVSDCQELSEPDTLYLQDRDIIPDEGDICITITAPNITFNCAHHHITNETKAGIGIYSDQVRTTIMNCDITVKMEPFVPVKGIGIQLEDADYSVLINNILDGQNKGLMIVSTDDASIIDNTMDDNMLTGIDIIESDHNIFSGNSAADNSESGIYMHSSDGNYLNDNIISTNGHFGILIHSGRDNQFYNNLIDTNQRGIRFEMGSDNNTLADSNIDDNAFEGITLISSSDNVLLDNNLNSNGEGIRMSSSSGNLLFNNNIYDCITDVIPFMAQACISLDDSSNNRIIGGEIEGSTDHLIQLKTGSDNNLFRDVNLIDSDESLIDLIQGENNTFLNISYDAIEEQVGSVGELFRMWYYKAYANDTSGNPVSDSEIRAYDKAFNLIETLTTGSSGWTEKGAVIEYANDGGIRTYYSDYSFNASHPNFNPDSHQKNITGQKNILDDFFILSEGPDCNDGIMNGDELGIDCGGSCPESDCCANGYIDENLGETGIDCGGPCIPCIDEPCPLVCELNGSMFCQAHNETNHTWQPGDGLGDWCSDECMACDGNGSCSLDNPLFCPGSDLCNTPLCDAGICSYPFLDCGEDVYGNETCLKDNETYCDGYGNCVMINACEGNLCPAVPENITCSENNVTEQCIECNSGSSSSSGGGSSSGSSSSGSSSSGGGGDSSANCNINALRDIPSSGIKSRKTRSWATVTAGNLYEWIVSENDISISRIIIIPAADLEDVKLILSILKENPGEAFSSGYESYEFFDIGADCIDDNSLESITITFFVDKSWLSNHGLREQDIVLKAYSGNKWTDVPSRQLTQPPITGMAVSDKTGEVGCGSILDCVLGFFKDFSIDFKRTSASGMAFSSDFVLFEATLTNFSSFAVVGTTGYESDEPEADNVRVKPVDDETNVSIPSRSDDSETNFTDVVLEEPAGFSFTARNATNLLFLLIILTFLLVLILIRIRKKMKKDDWKFYQLEILVKKLRKKGNSRYSIEQTLMKEGWPKNMIGRALKDIKHEKILKK